MASGEELTRIILKLPKELEGGNMMLTVVEGNDLDRTWATLILERDFARYELLFPRYGRRPRYIIKDNRPECKQWEMATGLVKDFINSFQNVQAVYHGSVVVDLELGSSESKESRRPEETVENLRTVKPKRVRFNLHEESEGLQITGSSSVPQKDWNLSTTRVSSSAAVKPSCKAFKFTGARETIASCVGISREKSSSSSSRPPNTARTFEENALAVVKEENAAVKEEGEQPNVNSMRPRAGREFFRNAPWKPSFMRRGKMKDVIKNDAVSMGDLVSSRDMLEDPTKSKDLKSSTVKNLQRNVNHDLLISVIKELEEVKGSGKLAEIFPRIPATAELIHQMFLTDKS